MQKCAVSDFPAGHVDACGDCDPCTMALGKPLFIKGYLHDQCEAGWRTDPETGERYNIKDRR